MNSSFSRAIFGDHGASCQSLEKAASHHILILHCISAEPSEKEKVSKELLAMVMWT